MNLVQRGSELQLGKVSQQRCVAWLDELAESIKLGKNEDVLCEVIQLACVLEILPHGSAFARRKLIDCRRDRIEIEREVEPRTIAPAIVARWINAIERERIGHCHADAGEEFLKHNGHGYEGRTRLEGTAVVFNVVELAAERCRLLEEMNCVSGMCQSCRRYKSTNASADDDDRAHASPSSDARSSAAISESPRWYAAITARSAAICLVAC